MKGINLWAALPGRASTKKLWNPLQALLDKFPANQRQQALTSKNLPASGQKCFIGELRQRELKAVLNTGLNHRNKGLSKIQHLNLRLQDANPLLPELIADLGISCVTREVSGVVDAGAAPAPGFSVCAKAQWVLLCWSRSRAHLSSVSHTPLGVWGKGHSTLLRAGKSKEPSRPQKLLKHQAKKPKNCCSCNLILGNYVVMAPCCLLPKKRMSSPNSVPLNWFPGESSGLQQLPGKWTRGT